MCPGLTRIGVAVPRRGDGVGDGLVGAAAVLGHDDRAGAGHEGGARHDGTGGHGGEEQGGGHDGREACRRRSDGDAR